MKPRRSCRGFFYVLELVRPVRVRLLEDGVFAGTSSGANMLASMRVLEQLGREASVATLIVDSGLKYVNTDVYRNP